MSSSGSSSDSENDMEDMTTTPDIQAQAQLILDELLPSKSKAKYLKAYTNFVQWQNEKNTKSLSQNVLLTYFNELSKNKKPSTVWATYSMIKCTVLVKHNINIKDYTGLTAFLKRQSEGYKVTKSRILTKQNIEKFLKEAIDHKYLVTKVVLIFGVNGACTSNELANMTTNDIESHNDMLLINICNSKTKVDRSFVVRDEALSIVKKYVALRPEDINTNKFFLNYQNGKCTRQVIGRHKIASMPQQIAIYLKLPDPKCYTGHCFRRSSVSLLANSGTNLIIKRHRGWKSDRVAESYVEDSDENKSKIRTKVNETINLQAAATSTTSSPPALNEETTEGSVTGQETTNANCVCNESNPEQEYIQRDSTITPTQPPSAKRKQQDSPELLEAKKQMDQVFSFMKQISQQSRDAADECSVFGTLVAKKLRKLSEQRRDVMMVQISQLFVEEHDQMDL